MDTAGRLLAPARGLGLDGGWGRHGRGGAGPGTAARPPAPRSPGPGALRCAGTERGVPGQGRRSRGAAGRSAGRQPGCQWLGGAGGTGDTGQQLRLGPAAGMVAAAAHAPLPSYAAVCLSWIAAVEFRVMQKLEVKGAPWLFTRAAGGRLCTHTAPHMLSTRQQRATGRCRSRALFHANAQLHTRTLRAHANPRLSAAQPNRCTRKSGFPYLYPLPQMCAEKRPNPVSKQCNSGVTSVQFMTPHWNKSWHVRSESGIQDNSIHSIKKHKKTQLKTLRTLQNIKTGMYN